MRSVAVITGGGRGIGARTAVLLASRGWDVCIRYRSDGEAAQAVVAECAALGVRAVAVRGEITSAAEVAALFTAADELGRLGALVNNAGIVGRKARVDEMTPERVSRMFEVNVVGAFRCSTSAAAADRRAPLVDA